MKNIRIYILVLAFVFTLVSCSSKNSKADAYGNFEAVEIIVASETAGRIVSMNIKDGQGYDKGYIAYNIDTVQLYLKYKEILAKKKAALIKKENIQAQAEVYQQQKKVIRKEKERIEKLLLEGAATSKQLDDVVGKIEVLDKQIRSVQSNLNGIDAEVSIIEIGRQKVKDQLKRSAIRIPINGVVLTHYAEYGESVAPGRPLFRMANLDEMQLRAYISGDQLSKIILGQDVKVKIDGDNGELKEFPGKVSWIASEAEFTPKNIQTKEERLSQVYAIKVLVKNSGAIKINMPGEVYF